MEKQMEMDKAQFAEQLKNLVELGKKKKNVLEYQEINDFFKGITLNNEQMDLIFEYLEANVCWKVYFVKPVIEIFAKQKRTMTGIFQGRQLFLKKTGCFFVILLCSGTGKKSSMCT